MPTGIVLERLGHLAVGQRFQPGAELGAMRVAGEPAQVAATRGAALVRGVLARELCEIGAAGAARAPAVELRLRLRVVAGDQDLPRLELGDGAVVRRLAGHGRAPPLE